MQRGARRACRARARRSGASRRRAARGARRAPACARARSPPRESAPAPPACAASSVRHVGDRGKAEPEHAHERRRDGASPGRARRARRLCAKLDRGDAVEARSSRSTAQRIGAGEERLRRASTGRCSVGVAALSLPAEEHAARVVAQVDGAEGAGAGDGARQREEARQRGVDVAQRREDLRHLLQYRRPRPRPCSICAARAASDVSRDRRAKRRSSRRARRTPRPPASAISSGAWRTYSMMARVLVSDDGGRLVAQPGQARIGVAPPGGERRLADELAAAVGMERADLRRRVGGVVRVQRHQRVDVVSVEGVEPRACDGKGVMRES